MSVLPTWSIQDQHRALCRAAAQGHAQEVAALLPSLRWSFDGPAVPPLDRSSSFDDGWLPHTPLAHAAEGGHLSVIDLLLDHGATLNHRGDDGMSALHHAILTGQAKAMEHLIVRGADPGLTDMLGHTALMLAVAVPHPILAERLIRLGASIDGRGALGHTALHIAAEGTQADHGHLAQLLLDHGADPSLTSELGMTPLEQARRTAVNGRTPAFDVLFAYHMNVTVGRERAALDQALDEVPTGPPSPVVDPRRRL